MRERDVDARAGQRLGPGNPRNVFTEALALDAACVHGNEGDTGGRDAFPQSVDHLGLREDPPRGSGGQRKAVRPVLP